MQTLHRIVQELGVVSTPDKGPIIQNLTQCRESFDRDTVNIPDRYTALVKCFCMGLASAIDDMKAIAALGESCAKIKQNTSKLLAHSLEIIEPLHASRRDALLAHRAHASQVLSEEAPTAAYLVYSGQSHYVAIGRSFRESIVQLTNVIVLLNNFVQVIDCEDPDPSLLDILATEIALQKMPTLSGDSRSGRIGNRLLRQLLGSLADDSKVGKPIDPWIRFEEDIDLPALDPTLAPYLTKWSSTMDKCAQDLERHSRRRNPSIIQESTYSIMMDLVDRLIHSVSMFAAQRMMCNHFRNLVVAQFKVTATYYEQIVTDLQIVVDDGQKVLGKVAETLASLEP